MCGGDIAGQQGLSPLARGNRASRARQSLLGGPIPARAGEPRRRQVCDTHRRAYPRSRGGTAFLAANLNRRGGLSPLARGNHFQPQFSASKVGPIPARAGEPRSIAIEGSILWAYPRSRGGTSAMTVLAVPELGLSPLARGNLVRGAFFAGILGPIPARAGEPSCRGSPSSIPRAYPRSRGGTWWVSCGCSAALGLSPLARGNPGRCCRCIPRQGPIPARAGEPGGASDC